MFIKYYFFYVKILIMSENIYAYNLKNKNLVYSKDRDEFYKELVEDFENEKETREAVEVINVFLFNSDGDILIQKRGKNKNHNPGLMDKSLGGHVEFGDEQDYTVMIETVEELQTPSIVLKNQMDFNKTKEVFKNYSQSIAIIKNHVTAFFTLDKVIDGKIIPMVNKCHLYFGYYDGTTRPADKEASGVLYYSLEDLKDEIKRNPENFTYDLKFHIDRFEEDIRDFIDYIRE